MKSGSSWNWRTVCTLGFQPVVGRKHAVPFVQAAAGGGFRVLRVEGQQHEFVGLVLLQLRDGFAGEGMPVAHGDDDAGVEIGSQFAFERRGLSEGVFEDGRTAADFRVVMLPRGVRAIVAMR